MIFALGLLLFAAQTAPAAPADPQPVASDKVEIVVFSDFQCPFCARFAASIRALEASGVDGVTVVVRFKYFPLPIHPRARLAHAPRLRLSKGEKG
jgi:protein-disulfide isomerase